MSITDRHTEELVRRLTEPFKPEAIKTRSGGGNTRLSYVEAHTVIRRLNAATGGRWDFQVLHEQQDGDLLKATCRLTIPGLGSREHVGVQKVSERGGEDLHKGAISDALKKCATLFGVGLELYGEDYEAERPGGIGAGDFDTLLADASNLHRAGKPYAEVYQSLQRHKQDMSEPQIERVKQFLKAIKPGQPATPAGHAG